MRLRQDILSILGLLAFSVVPLAASASVVCIPGTIGEVVGDDLQVQHPNINGGGALYAGTFHATIDCATPTLLYCVGINVNLCLPGLYTQGPDLASQEAVWILNNYYPTVPGMPSELATNPERAAAVQLALWHFSDGIDISTGGSNLAVFDAARAIIAAALLAPVPLTPTSLTLTPLSYSPASGTLVTVTATLRDQNGAIMPNYPISWTRTNVSPFGGSGTTDVNGEYTVSWTESGGDLLTFDVDYSIPVGLRWILAGCQSLIQGVSVPGHLTMNWGEAPTATAHTTWSNIKSLQYR